ncbi:hypothetical protein G6011_05048 [Alternaria panax]|uniref:Glycosyltransferase family 31 protein n=1 Tax=Alternaria panax TaxID=48097 RepID=A0AAD4FBX4_9PLEO|nr:hypothetical protein G6011_05048 [Alternaria panax]
MPLITPSRLAIIVVSFSLITFFWTFGLPHQIPQPSIPAIDHYDHKNVHTDPIIPPPVIETPHATTPTPIAHGHRPTESGDHRWDDNGKGQAKSSAPTETGVVDYEKDGGRWEDKEKLKSSAKPVNKTNASAIPAPTTLATEAIPASKSANAPKPDIAPTKPAEAAVETQLVEKFCSDADGAKDVMVVLKTSKAEIEKLSGHLSNLLSCVPTFAIFSDHAGEFQGHKVHDALDSISHDVKFKNNEFQEYQLMLADAEHKPEAKKTEDLDKWKFLPMVYKAYHMNPSAKFFVFLEADTSLSWTNVLQWLNRLDYRIPYYSGAPYFIAGTQVAQRGAGIMLSQGALRRYSKSYDELYQTKWEKDTSTECCGDLMLAKALGDAHVEFYASWPLLQSEQPSTLDYTRKHWCAPAVSWHHIGGDDLTRQWDIEKKWTTANGWKKPYLYRDAYHDSVEPHIEKQKAGWDNLSQDTKIVAPEGRQKQMKDDTEKKKKEGQEHDLAEPEEKAEEKPKEEVKPKEAAKKESKEKPKEVGQTQQEERKEPEKIKVDSTPPPDSRIYQEAGPGSMSKREEKKGGKKGDKKEDKDKKPDPPNWDKLAEKYPEAADSSARCQAVCQQVEDCLQWRYTTNGDGECHLSKVIRLGGKVGEDKWTSGWLVDRIKGITKEWECKEVKWRFYQ